MSAVPETTAAGGTSIPDRPQQPRPSARQARRRARSAAAFGALTLAVLGYATFQLAGHLGTHAAAVPRATSSTAPLAAKPAVTPTAPVVTASPASTPGAKPVPLTVVSASAFGPLGPADGDNQRIAARVLTDPARGWLSQWYATPNFGDLKQGTGLLLDLGSSDAVSAVRVFLGSLPGATVQVRLGQRPALAALTVAGTSTAATASDIVTIRLAAPVHARYVLVWFTRLPPDGAGHYQAWVRQVRVQGQPLR